MLVGARIVQRRRIGSEALRGEKFNEVVTAQDWRLALRPVYAYTRATYAGEAHSGTSNSVARIMSRAF